MDDALSDVNLVKLREILRWCVKNIDSPEIEKIVFEELSTADILHEPTLEDLVEIMQQIAMRSGNKINGRCH